MKDLATIPYFSDWPEINSKIAIDPQIETAVAEIVALMTVEEKIGQMIQPNLRGVSPEEATKYKLGTILNGGGAWPKNNKHASAKDWAETADLYWFAVEKAFEDRPFRIPFMWATDAVHGHNNAFRATVFPHNIGLGAARDLELIERIGEITALEISATGLDWTFAPTVATPRDLRWGRVYEGYSEDPQITYHYASQMVKGLQGNSEELKSQTKVVSNVKHWVGDGGTLTGVDRGQNSYSEELLRNIHAMGYFSGLEAGAQVVMSSFNSWTDVANYDHSPEIEGSYNHKIHGSKYLLTDILKQKMGFDGLIVTDWHGHAEVSKCSDGDASYAINAGNDVLMVPVHEHWINVYEKTLRDIESGIIPMQRIDDAVTRILRVKMRAGMWEKPQPSMRQVAGNQEVLGAPEHRAVAREAVRKSLVLLKNNDKILPLSNNQKILLTGSAADDLQKQSGGWNLTWQGDENTLEDFPGATTVKSALVQTLGTENVIHDPELNSDLGDIEVAVVVFGEDPYAEMMGDIKAWQSLEFRALKRSYQRDAQKIHQLHQAGIRVVSIFFSGRPLYLNQEISQSEAFIAAWLPGSEGLGITDVLVGDQDGNPNFDFQGRLSFSWPNKKLSTTVNRIPTHIPNYVLAENEQDPNGEHKPLFPYGYGLSYSKASSDIDVDLNNIELDNPIEGDGAHAKNALELYGIKSVIGDYQLKIADSTNWAGANVSRNNAMTLNDLSTEPFNYQQQQDAVEITFHNTFGAVYLQAQDGSVEDLTSYTKANGKLSVELKVSELPTEPVYIGVQKQLCIGDMPDIAKQNITSQITKTNTWLQIDVPLAKFEQQGVDMGSLDTLFMLFTQGSFKTVVANIRVCI